MDQTITITPFEEQVLQAMSARWREAYSCAGIHRVGWEYLTFCADWAGTPQHVPHWFHGETYPKINFALGRLRQKGLVERFDSEYMSSQGFRSGRWGLTDQGKLLMGCDLE